MPDDVQACDRAAHGSSELHVRCQEQKHLFAWLVRVFLRPCWAASGAECQNDGRFDLLSYRPNRTRFRNETVRFNSEIPWMGSAGTLPGPDSLDHTLIRRL
jgi:hypothetical protein